MMSRCTQQGETRNTQLSGIRSPPGLNAHETNVKKTLGHSLVNIRPWPAGETITGWLDHSAAGAGGLEETTAEGGLAFPTDGGVISRERWGR